MIGTSGPIPPLSTITLPEVLLLQASGLFDGAWFADRNPDLATCGTEILAHFHLFGWKEQRNPNAYFDTAWYLESNPDVRDKGANPLLHYAQHGESEGRAPIAHFDPAWYRETYAVPPGGLCLAHFLKHRATGTVSPIPEFDCAFYLARYPDIAEAGMDPFEHYLVRGAQEDRQPAPGFDPHFYRRRYLVSRPSANPLLHYRMNRHRPGIYPCRPAHEADIPSQVRRFTRQGPAFEEQAPLPTGMARRAKLLAYYLPQFHPVPENDAWWGKGFTEWTNIARALPRFAGHYQPRIPRDLGHYRLEADVLRRQAQMARGAGLHGFVFYFYWFDGRRLLESPLEALLADPSIDLPFCLMWANENWTRRWDGSEHEVLLAQNYRMGDEAALVAEFLRHFADPRYIRLQGRPVLMVYRAGLIPPGAVPRWRRLFAEAGEEPLFVMAQSFDDRDPRRVGMDAAVEFPPHKLVDGLSAINATLEPLDHAATAQVFAYDDMAAQSDLGPQPFPLIRTVLPGWDNDPRRQGAGMVLHGATPAAYQAWLTRVIDAARAQPVGGEALVCINAWNEWGEGAYLEPDVHFGAAFLNATGRAVSGDPAVPDRVRLLLVGHDAFPAGSQLLLLNLARTLREVHGLDVAFLLLGEGALLSQYRAVAPTTVLQSGHDLAGHARQFAAQGFRAAIVNTCAAATACRPLAEAGLTCTLLVHELPRLLRERNLVGIARDAVDMAHPVVFPASYVRDRFSELVTIPPERTAILPQGLYRPVHVNDRDARRAQLRVPKTGLLAIGIGYADLRKGFDLFMQAWRAAQNKGAATHMLWVGDIDPTVHAYLGAEIAVAEATGTFHHIPFGPDGADWFAAADVHLLTSREDPLPTVVMEAMSAGLPTIAFEESGGAPDLIRECQAGVSVPLADVAAMVRQIRPLATRHASAAAREKLRQRARALFDFGHYAESLLHLACPALLDVSVVVPNYNYGRFLPERLGTIFAQTYPVAEVIVLDDASSDDSAHVVARVAAEAGRRVRWLGSDRNGGSVFKQWRRAATLARSEWLWIAEADDQCQPGFLAALAGAVHDAPDIVLAFTDSRAIDRAGQELWPDHQAYYRQAGATMLEKDGVFPAPLFLREGLAHSNVILNVSAVLWRRSALLAALDRCGPELDTFTMAGDWRLYAELLAAAGPANALVAYVAQPLNTQRRHAASVTRQLPADRHLAEIERMQRHMRALLGPDPTLARSQRKALGTARLALTPPTA
jgi:glycosyltransferase involved in cell wall biosynthesis